MSPAATTTSGFVAVDVNENTKKKWAAAPKDYVVPKMLDLTIENITGNVISVNSCVKDNPRLQYIITKLIQVSHNFVRDVQLQFDEWEQAWQYLTRVGQISTDVRHEMVLLSDILGISALVDSISFPTVPGSTESSILGPFHDDDAHFFSAGESIASANTPGDVTLVRGNIRDLNGNPVEKALIDVWETDGNGVYDLEYGESEGPNCRGKVSSDNNGNYAFLCVKPVAYPISNDGPVGELLRTLNRHWYRPAHMHFMILHPQYKKLITALYSKDSKYIESDTVFGVKQSLIVDYVWTTDLAIAKQYGITPFARQVDGVETKGFWLLEFDFTLVKDEGAKL